MGESLITCEHLQAVEAAIRKTEIQIEVEGDWWGNGNKQSVYFKCRLDQALIRKQFELDSCVEWTEYDGRMAGHESGLHCPLCKSFLVGGHPNYEEHYPVIWPEGSSE